MNRAVQGALTGFVATVPMTAWMVALHRLLPDEEQYPLPPRTVTMKMAARTGTDQALTKESHRTVATLCSHFAFGAASGIAYALVKDKLPAGPIAGGMLFGLGVWAGSYLGWLPALRIRRPSTELPLRREALMASAHLVWGAVAAATAERLQEA